MPKELQMSRGDDNSGVNDMGELATLTLTLLMWTPMTANTTLVITLQAL